MGEKAGDTKTLSTNVLETELEALKGSRLRKRFRSVSDLVRYAIHEVAKIEDNELALEWEAARLNRWITNCSVLAVGSLTVLQSVFGSLEPVRRNPQSTTRPCMVRSSWGRLLKEAA